MLLYDDIAYGASLGRTAKFPRDSIAFTWADELQETTLSYIEWSASRTGLINPVPVFQPVELEGTTVSRASVHNRSIMEGLELGAGDRITVYKANMIIPQIADNLTRSGVRDIPAHCPVCGGATEIRKIWIRDRPQWALMQPGRWYTPRHKPRPRRPHIRYTAGLHVL